MKLALIGCGAMGRMHAEMAQRCGIEIAVCTDKDAKAAKAAAAAFGARAVASVETAVKRPEVDLVCICTPTPRHSGAVIAAAAAGKHIFCEKPFARTMQQCRAALAAVKRGRVKLFIGHVVRYFHEFEAIKREVENGKIGTPGFARLYRGGIYPGAPGSWFQDYSQSGGAIFDMSIHDLDWVRYMFGEPERIFCQSLQRTKPEYLDYGMVTMRMKSGILTSFTGSWAHPQGFRVKVEVVGDGGLIQYDSDDAPITSMMRASAGLGPSMIVPASPEVESPYQLEWQDFHDWITLDRAPRVHPEDGVRALEMALAAEKSAATGKPVKL